MRKLLLILLLLMQSYLGDAQKIRFTDTVNSWKYERAIWTPYYAYYSQYDFDSIVTRNGTTYTSIPNYGLCREDTLINKVFVITVKDTVERLLFDYNLKKGDTLAYQFFGFGVDSAKGVIIDTDSSLIAGNYYKTWHFRNLDFPNRNTIIVEGIGVLRWEGWDTNETVVCFSRNGAPIPIKSYVSTNSYTCALDVNNINADNNTVTISPNPANQYSTIKFPYTIQSGSLTITDILGKAVSTKTINNNTETTIGTMPASGLYFYNLRDFTNNQSYTGKFIYE